MNKEFALALILVITISTSSIFMIEPTYAQSKTIIVPDGYLTIASAIGNATNGDTILVRSGTYEGPINSTLVINKSLSIIGENTRNTIINLYPAYTQTWIAYTPEDSYADAITITANSCSLQDLTLQDAIEGNYPSNGGDVTAEGNYILIADNTINTTGVNIQGSNCRVTNNVMDGTIEVTGNYNQIDNNSCSSVGVGVSQVNGQSGGSYDFVRDNTCQGLGLTNCSNNVFFGNNSPAGIDISQSNNNFIYENQITGSNFFVSVSFWQSSNNTIEANDFDFTDAGALVFSASNNNLFTLNDIYGNYSARYPYYVIDQALSIDPNMADGLTLSTNIWSYNNLGNYWGDYLTKYPNATEVDGTGAGSIPYAINANNSDSYPLMSPYDISTAPIQLPDWTNLILPTVIQAPASPQPSTTATTTPLPPSSIPSSTPTSTVPELSCLVIAPLLLSMFAFAVIFRHRKTSNLAK